MRPGADPAKPLPPRPPHPHRDGRLGRTLALAAALGLLTPCAARACGGAAEFATMEVHPVPSLRPHQPNRGLLTAPAAWHPGCTAAVLAWVGPDMVGARMPALSRLIEADVAVLELWIEASPGAVPAAADLVPDLYGALHWLRDVARASQVFALGVGTAGEAAELAVQDAAQARFGRGERGLFDSAARIDALGGFHLRTAGEIAARQPADPCPGGCPPVLSAAVAARLAAP